MPGADLTPPAGAREEAQRGLDWRREFGRGGTEVGIARARDIAGGRSLSEDTVQRMVSYFARHETDKAGEGWSPGEDGYPSNGRIAWALWGGDAGRTWAEKVAAQLDKESMGVGGFSPGAVHSPGAVDDLAVVKSMSAFSVNAFRFALSPEVGVGKWDRITSWGLKVKDGSEIEFNADTLGQMVDNFAAQRNDVAMSYDHQSAYVEVNGQPAPALAWYNALALVVDGKVAKFAAHDKGVRPLDPAGLENGVYAHRSEVTPLGEKLLPNYKFVSPLFTTAGESEDGKAIGFQLLDVSATNTPFQDGVGLTFHRGVHGARVAYASNADRLREEIRAKHQRGSITADEKSRLLRELDNGTPVAKVEEMIKSAVGYSANSRRDGVTTMASATYKVGDRIMTPDGEGVVSWVDNDHHGWNETVGVTFPPGSDGAKKRGAGMEGGFRVRDTRKLSIDVGSHMTTGGVQAMAKDMRGNEIRVGDRVGGSGLHTQTVTAIRPNGDVVVKDSRGEVDVLSSGLLSEYYVKMSANTNTGAARRFSEDTMTDEKKDAPAAMTYAEIGEALAKKFGFADPAECAAKMGDLVIKHEGEEEEKPAPIMGEGKDEARALADEDKIEAEKLADDLGVEKGKGMFSRIRLAMSATRAPVAEVAKLKSEVARLSKSIAEREQAERDAALARFADDAITAGQWDSSNRDSLIAFARADIKAAEKSLLPRGTYTLLSRVSSSVTASREPSVTVGDANKRGVAFSRKVREVMQTEKIDDYIKAAGIVQKRHPELDPNG